LFTAYLFASLLLDGTLLCTFKMCQGERDEKWGERPLALIVLQQENASGITERHIQAHVREWAERGVISKWAVPEVRFVDFLEKTSVGKLDKNVLRQKHG
jgi:fatty-acyl-CoA synthase